MDVAAINFLEIKLWDMGQVSLGTLQLRFPVPAVGQFHSHLCRREFLQTLIHPDLDLDDAVLEGD
jgi:hypothetical protein